MTNENKKFVVSPENPKGVLVDMTSEEIAQRKKDLDAIPSELDRALNSLREKRNNLLAKTDWTSSSDLTMSDAMTTYRQQLRDATTGLDTVEKIEAYEFPTEVLK
jgi:chromosome segregation ATPase